MQGLHWGSIQLRPLENFHLPLLYSWRNSAVYLSNLTSRSALSSFEDFILELEKDFAEDRELQFIIYLNKTPVGTIYSYGLNNLDKYSFFSIYTDTDFHLSGIGIKASVLYCELIFKTYELYKIYVDVYEYNNLLINLLIKRGIALEGRFKKHHLYKDKRCDVYRFAIYQTDILDWRKKYSN